MALTQERAEERSKSIRQGSITYNFHISLQKGEYYSGYSQISFELIDVPCELVLDFKGKDLITVTQNGEQIEAIRTIGFIHLQVNKLKVGSNKVGVHYVNKYDNDGSGCVSFVDTDSKQYISTQFAPYYANRVFPCFDQPDLKATMSLTIICPSQWKKVLSNETAIIEQELNKEQYLKLMNPSCSNEVLTYLQDKSGRMTIFPSTEILSTYLYCFIAGQYKQLKIQEQKQYKKIPMSLYCIQSLYSTLRRLAPFIFQITIESMKFYQIFFNYQFAFKKYDQIFAHQYKWGAMENAGSVVFNDRCLFRETVSTERMFNFAITISHELSHHWFGNLVTMRWWDDLWLNETFATFISYLCLQKIKQSLNTIKYQSSMQSFFQAKGRGYLHDQMITTHPIRGPVSNTNVADTIFDGITYSKGAATMKQFCYLMGQEAFGKGLASYFDKYAWKNATIDDFLAQMQTFSHLKEFSLAEWKEMWLEKASLNLLQPQWASKDISPSAKFIIKQSIYTPKYPTLRFHKIKVALYLQNCDTDIIEVLVKPEEQTIVEYNGQKQYKAILLNYQDHTFVKTVIDPISLDFFTKNINSVKDILSRSLIWNSFFEMIRDAKITSFQLVDIIVSSLSQEHSDSIFQKMLDNVLDAINSYTPEKYRQELSGKMFNYLYHLLPTLSAQLENRSTIIKAKITNFALSEEHIYILLKWSHQEEEHLKGIKMSGIQKWWMLAKIFTLKSLTLDDKEKIFTSVKSIDVSDISKNYRHLCDSLGANDEDFQKTYQFFKDKECNHSVTLKQYIAKGWNHPYNKEKLLRYRDRYFKDIQEMSDYMSGDHFFVFYNSLAPIDDDLEYQIAQFEQLKFPAGKEKVALDILKMIDELKRRLKTYRLYQQK